MMTTEYKESTQEEIDAYINAGGHPPIAEGVILVDFDQTIKPASALYSFQEPLPGAVDAINRLVENGYTVYIFTSRLSRKWLKAEGHLHSTQLKYLKEYCKLHGIPVKKFTAEKIPSIAIYDDKSIRVRDTWEGIDHEQYGVDI